MAGLLRPDEMSRGLLARCWSISWGPAVPAAMRKPAGLVSER